MSDADARTVHAWSELRSSGLLWALNKNFLHGRGFALAVEYADGADPDVDEPVGWSLMGDGTEAWQFVESADDECFPRFEAFLNEHRMKAGE